MYQVEHIHFCTLLLSIWTKRIINKKNWETLKNSHKIKGVLEFSERLSLIGSEGLNQVESKEIYKSISTIRSLNIASFKNSQYLDMKDINEKTSDIKRNNFGSNVYYMI